jgi:hypothetical protein
MSKNSPIPLYTKIGGRLTLILIILLSFMLLRNCVRSVQYGSITTQEEIKHSYDMGYKDGKNQVSKQSIDESEQENPVLKKAYRQGYREGWDSTQ